MLGESPTYILNEDTQPVTHARSEYHTHSLQSFWVFFDKIFDLTAGWSVFSFFYNNILRSIFIAYPVPRGSSWAPWKRSLKKIAFFLGGGGGLSWQEAANADYRVWQTYVGFRRHPCPTTAVDGHSRRQTKTSACTTLKKLEYVILKSKDASYFDAPAKTLETPVLHPDILSFRFLADWRISDDNRFPPAPQTSDFLFNETHRTWLLSDRHEKGCKRTKNTSNLLWWSTHKSSPRLLSEIDTSICLRKDSNEKILSSSITFSCVQKKGLRHIVRRWRRGVARGATAFFRRDTAGSLCSKTGDFCVIIKEKLGGGLPHT